MRGNAVNGKKSFLFFAAALFFLDYSAAGRAGFPSPQSAPKPAAPGYQYTNRLIDEKSPYLLLHAHNPVDWYPWGNEAFERAKREQKPIFLSIGYYTCHWCHVMERESYSNPEIAAVLNRYFVAIKVDREERPDVDRLYIAYLESTTKNAGWPLNVFLTSDLKPFGGGVYFAPDELRDLLLKIAGDWAKDRDHVVRRASRATQELLRTINESRSAEGRWQASTLDKAFHQIAATYDGANGGFGGAPKFPRPVLLEFLLRTHTRTGRNASLDMTLGTLRAMASGGIHDQLGGGFHRYSTDAKWRVPHFEKMLYDQAQLAVVYTEAYQVTKDRLFAGVARDVLDFSLRELQLPGGGFGSALDADSALAARNPETAEGAFYLWTMGEIETTLGKQTTGMFDYAYGLEPGGNTSPRIRNRSEAAPENVLYERHAAEETGVHFGVSASQASDTLAAARRALFEARSRRPPPPLDDKIVTAWNGMIISALARATRALDEPRYLAAAQGTAQLLESHLYDPKSGQLWRSYRAGSASLPGVLDDYVDLISGLLDLYQASFALHYLQWAEKLQDKQDELFWDSSQGGYFDATASDATLLARTRESYDGAEPSPNSVAAMNLLRLAEITGRTEWREKAHRTFVAFGAHLASDPETVPALASAMDFDLAPSRHVLIAGDPAAPDTRELLQQVNHRFLPNVILLLADGGQDQEQLARWLPFVAGAHRINGRATAYICDSFVCKLPTTDPIVTARLLDTAPRPQE
jgi:uncharacterized protein YyaL (SSP411 family)